MDTGCKKSNFIYQNLPFLIFFAFFTIMAWDVAKPMTSPIIWAAMLSFVSMPIFTFINKRLFKERFRSLSSALTLIVLLVICVVPLAYIISTLAAEASGMGIKLARFIAKFQSHAFSVSDISFPSWMPLWASDYIKSFLANSAAVKNVMQSAAQWGAKALSALSGTLIEQGSAFLFNTMIMLMVSFFFIRDGGGILRWIKSVLPLTP